MSDMNEKQPSHILIDWGTSSFRLWGVGPSGDVLFEKHEPLGMLKLSPPDYEPLLEKILLLLGVTSKVPVLICGMAGATQGWQGVSYIDLPTKLDTLSTHAVKVKTQGRDVRILPGLAQRSKSAPDVMRGEEALLLGALRNEFLYETYCMPGTHSKWVEIANGEVHKFQTFMTGELFALLNTYSTLSHFLDDNDGSLDKHPAFENAVSEVATSPNSLMNALFTIRSGALLFPSEDRLSALARLSGLLIGTELAAMKGEVDGKIGLIATGQLSDHYSKAMEILGMEFDLIDSHELALAGLSYCAQKIWGSDES